MFDFVDQLLTRWFAKTSPGVRLNPYNVTPRQGRYTVQRKLLRAIHRQFAFAAKAVLAPSASKS
jgi:hypothetical protein